MMVATNSMPDAATLPWFEHSNRFCYLLTHLLTS